MRRDNLSTYMYYVYILQNIVGRQYIGSCQDLAKRLRRHNQNSVRSTKHQGPFTLIYKEGFSAKTESRKRENELKQYKNPQYLRRLLKIGSTLSSSLV